MKMLNEGGTRVLADDGVKNGAYQALFSEGNGACEALSVGDGGKFNTVKNGAYLGASAPKSEDEKFILEYGESLAEGDLRPILLKNYDGAYKAPQQNPAYYENHPKPSENGP